MKDFKNIILATIGIALIIVAFIFGINGVQNKAIGLEEQIKVADSDVKVQEKRRVDLVYNLVDTVKQYDKHEAETLRSVIDLRKKEGGNIGDENE